ncbi:helix-turn-helix transcriptional regulator [Kitasatospora sp. NPDC002040]|uniref:helix-turn-helix domain-containing protein n=1 Tax=Kitasatospora sp. NPDC002040 TaxID=3154661 RepID=UPI003325CCE1
MPPKQLDPTSSPLAALAVHLRRSRVARALTQVELGKLIQYSSVYISTVETAKQPPSLKFVSLADAALGAQGTLELLWWSWKNGALIPGFADYTPREAEALVIRLVDFRLIPGPLQTLEHAAAWEAGNVRRGSATPTQADARVATLAARQRGLERTPAPVVHAVIDESCLYRPVGGPAVMARQLKHLESLSERSNVILQVAPYSLAEDHPFSHPVVLLTMPNRAILGYTETLQRGYLERDSETVATWAGAFDRLQVDALSKGASQAMIREIRKDLERHAR